MDKSQLTYEWQPYDGDYCKAVQDIRLQDGTEIEGCYPNAGVWLPIGENSTRSIKNADVTHVRKSYSFYN